MRGLRSRIRRLEGNGGDDPLEVVIDDYPDSGPVTAIANGITIYDRKPGESEAELLARVRAIPVYEIRCLTVLRGGSRDML